MMSTQHLVSEIDVSRRLVNVGETIVFTLTVDPRWNDKLEFHIFPRYLESCDCHRARQTPGRLAWLDGMPAMSPPLSFQQGQARVEFTVVEPGNYMARLTTPEKKLYRYFAAVTPDYLVYRMQAYGPNQPPVGGPEFRNGGIPIDWAMSDRYLDNTLDPRQGYLSALLEYQEELGDLVMPWFSGNPAKVRDDPGFDLELYVATILERMSRAGFGVGRALCDWVASPSAVEVYRKQGIEIVDGIIPEGEWHRGAPWFPYWIDAADFLSPATKPTSMMAMIMDFCAGFHFHGPPDFHMIASECNWAVSAPRAELGAREHALVVTNSAGGPVFIPTLMTFEYHPWGLWPKRDWPRKDQWEFSRQFLDEVAFEHARKFPIAFARCVDIADYLRDHPSSQPRRILSSITHDWIYDRWWSPEWCNHGVETFRDVLPFNDSLGDIRRRRPYIWAKPTARELIYYEDHRHSCRFEVACPKPILWYDYRDSRRDVSGGRSETEVPDPKISVIIRMDEHTFELSYRIRSDAPFAGYKLAVWDIPREFAEYPVTTNADEWFLVRNADGDFRGILGFDLSIETEIHVRFSKGGVGREHS